MTSGEDVVYEPMHKGPVPKSHFDEVAARGGSGSEGNGRHFEAPPGVEMEELEDE